MAAKGMKKGLGKGIDSLIPVVSSKARRDNGAKRQTLEENTSEAENPKNHNADTKQVQEIENNQVERENEQQEKNEDSPVFVKISSVEPNREQPRKAFNEDSMLELADSVRQYGIIQPLLVQKKEDYYEIIAGERRWRAAKLAGLREVPVIIREFSEQEILEISLIENIQRENLNPIEEAIAYKRLLNEFKLKQDEIADRVSKSRTAVTNSLRLLKLDVKVQQMLIEEMISSGHARALLGIADKEQQRELATKIFDEKLSVRETEKLVKTILNPKEKKEKEIDTTQEAIYEHLEEKMKTIMGTKVSINRKNQNKGRIEIEYYSQEELERIIELIESVG